MGTKILMLITLRIPVMWKIERVVPLQNPGVLSLSRPTVKCLRWWLILCFPQKSVFVIATTTIRNIGRFCTDRNILSDTVSILAFSSDNKNYYIFHPYSSFLSLLKTITYFPYTSHFSHFKWKLFQNSVDQFKKKIHF